MTRSVRFIVASALTALAIAPSEATVLAAPARAPSIPGWLHTKGGHIETARGARVRLLGVDYEQSSSTNDEGSPSPDRCYHAWRMPGRAVARDLSSWGFNIVRLAVTWGNLEPTAPTMGSNGTLTHHWNGAYLSALDAAIERFHRAGVAVVLDMHQYFWSSAFKNVQTPYGRVICEGEGMPTWLYPLAPTETVKQAMCDFVADRTEPGVPLDVQEAFTAAWRLMAARYAGERAVVGADLLNEPFYRVPECSGADLDALYRRVADAVRSENDRLLLIFEDTAYRSDGAFGLTAPPTFPNAVYSFHTYRPTWAESRTELRAYWQRADAWNVPAWLGEFNAFGEGKGPQAGTPAWRRDTLDMLSWLKHRDVGWGFWAYAGQSHLVARAGGRREKLLRTLQAGF